MLDAEQFDIVVAGSGSAGLTAAVVAATSGLRVLLVEKDRCLGGTSAWSGGGCWIPANPLAAGIGVVDTQDDAEAYVSEVVGNHLRKDLFAAFQRHSNAMLAFMLKHTEVRFFPRTPAPDWRMDAPGAKIGGRSLASPTYDARVLGRTRLRQLSRPLNSFNAPMGMMMSPLDFMHAMKMFRSWASFRYMAALVGRYLVDLVRYGRGSRLAMGNALVARLLRSALDSGVTLWTETPAQKLEMVDGKVQGIWVLRNGRQQLVSAGKGVVLATGGFAADPALRAARFPQTEGYQSMAAPGNTGDGVRMALANTAVLETDNAAAGAWGVVSVLEGRNGVKARCLHFFTDLPKPGFIVVNPAGQRFGNEASLQLGEAMLATGATSAWIVGDHRAVKKYGVGLVWPYAFNLRLLQRAGYVRSAPTLALLARSIGVDPAALDHTIARFNAHAATGIDPDFKRGDSVLDRSMGDPSVSPNPSLGPIDLAPFHAVKVVLGDAGSVDGLRVDQHAQVVDDQGRPIGGLYACGLDMNSLWAGAPLAAGMNHAHNMTFAYIAARKMAGALEDA